jgi:PAS domain S-box-containing protein
MILFPYFELIAALFTLLFSFIIYSRHYENRTARFFARFALLAFLASILEYSLRIAFTLELAQTINRLSATLWAFVFPMYAHFCLIFSRKEKFLKKPYALLVLYLPALILGILFLFTNSLYSRHDIYRFGIASQPAPLYWLFTLNTVVYVAWGIALLIRQALSSPQRTVRAQAGLIAMGSILPALLGALTDEVLPLLQGYRFFPPTCVFDIAVMNLFIFIAMRRYALFAISPALAADTIIETMPDSMIVTDLEGRVILLNDEAHKYFKIPKEKILGHPIDTLFADKDKYLKLYEEVVVKNMEIERFAVDLTDPLGEKLPSLINANKVRDALGSTLGIVYIIRDVRG